MGFFRETSGKVSHKRIISFLLILVALIMGFMKYPIEYVYFFGISGLINIGMTVGMGIKQMKK